MNIKKISEAIISICIKKQLTVAAAESLTAGLFTANLATIPGASKVLTGGLIVYNNNLKQKLAKVSNAALNQYGPVSAITAEELAKGASSECEASIGLSFTGYAGPAIESNESIGLVYLGLYNNISKKVLIAKKNFSGTRNQIRSKAVLSGMKLLLANI